MAVQRKQRLRYSVRAWTAIIAVGAGPLAILGLFIREIPAGNQQTAGVVLGVVLVWGSKVVDACFRAPENRGAARPSNVP